MSPPVVSFIARSGTGKTTLLEKVVVELKTAGVRVGVIKSDAHKFEIDHEGKDTHRYFTAGADAVLITSPAKMAFIKRHEGSPSVGEVVERFFPDMDLVLVEGWKKSDLPKVEVHRKATGQRLLCRGQEYDGNLIAVASDEPLEVDVPILDLNDPAAVASFLRSFFPSRN